MLASLPSAAALRPALLGAACALAAACASGGGAAPQDGVQVQESARVIAPGVGTSGVIQTRTVSEDVVRASTIGAPIDRTWDAVVTAYTDLKLPVTMRADAQHQVGSQARRHRGAIGGTRMSLLFNCGAGATGGDAADSYELTVDVVSNVSSGATPNETVVRSMASAVAKPVMTSGEPVRCVSTGRLEDKVTAAAQKRLAGG